MLEVESCNFNERTNHWRMVVRSSITKCTLSLIETKDGIVTYTHCPKKITDAQIIERLEQIVYTHKMIAKCNTFDSLTLKVDDLVELIKDRPHRDKKESMGFHFGIPKLEDLE
jgi:hypothetical protein